MRTARLAILCLLWLTGACAAAMADEAVRVRAGDHPGFGRLVFDFPGVVEYRMSRDGDRVLLRFDTASPIRAPASYPRNVLGFAGGAGQAEIVVARGARIQPLRVGNGLAIDVWSAAPAAPAPEPASGAPAAGAARVKPAAAPAEAKPPVVARQPEPAAKTPVAPAAPVAPAEKLAPASTPAPTPPAEHTIALATEPEAPARTAPPTAAPSPAPPASADTPPRAETPPVTGGAASPLALAATSGPAGTARLPFASNTGAAAFRRGAAALLVFDERRPIDMAALRDDPVFASATVQLLPEATIVRLALPPSQGLVLIHAPDGWTVKTGRPAAAQAIVPVLADRRAMLAAAAPGRVLSVADPETGGMLLVGTQREPGWAVPVGRRTGEFVLLPTWQGVAVEPLSDNLYLRASKDGFVLGADPAGLALAPPSADGAALAAASALTRRFDFPPLSPEALTRRLQGEVEGVAAAPPLGRARGRRAAAETMVALGLGAEAQSMLRLAAAEDARELDDPDAAGLAAIAALLAGRGGEADGLADPRLDGTDEIALWRAVRQATANPGSAPAAEAFGATLPLLLAYPSGLRDRLLPLAAETMAVNGTAAAGPLLARSPADPHLALARGLWRQAKGDTDGALALFDQLAAGPDRLLRLRAATRAAELRLAAGTISPHDAADALERQIYAWRGDRREVELRTRVAELRAQAGEWRPSLALLRETETINPDERPAVHARLVGTFAALLADSNADKLAPLDLVALLDENADLLPDGEAGTELASHLADRLLALDLPRRADTVLTKLVGATKGAMRASFGARLAGLRLREGNPAGAIATLADTDAEELPQTVQQQRLIVRAGALARRGDPSGAARLLAEVGTREAAAMRASVLEDAHDWPLAEQALADYAAQTVPAEGALSEEQRRTVLRLAGATAQAGDAAALAALAQREGKRMAGGPVGDMFRLLTASPVQKAGDLPRAAQEIALARSVPSGLKAMVAQRPTP